MSTQPELTPAQERQRMDGLRVLARIIARHHLAHPELYPAPTVAIEGGTGGVGRSADPKEAAE